MANRLLQQFVYSFLKKFTKVVAEINIAADNSVSSFYGPGVQSAARTAAGTYTIVFQDQYVKFMGAHLQYLAATAIDRVPQIVSYTPATRTLVVRLLAGAVATDPGAVATLYLEANFRDSTVTV